MKQQPGLYGVRLLHSMYLSSVHVPSEKNEIFALLNETCLHEAVQLLFVVLELALVGSEAVVVKPVVGVVRAVLLAGHGIPGTGIDGAANARSGISAGSGAVLRDGRVCFLLGLFLAESGAEEEINNKEYEEKRQFFHYFIASVIPAARPAMP